jgi:hypothetical protein
MKKFIKPKFIKEYWHNIEQISRNKFIILNTQRRRNQIDRDGLGYYLEENFKTLKEAEEFLENLKTNS